MASTERIGAWRDRTNLFISYRQSYAHHPAKRTRLSGPSTSSNTRYNNSDGDSERAGLMFNQDTDGDAIIEMDLLPPRWLDIQDEITTSLTQITADMKKLEQMHAKHVLPGFDDESVKAREEREIERLTQDITRGFTGCSSRIRRIDTLVREQQSQQGGNLSQADEKMARNLKMSLAARVGEVSTVFRKKQAAYLKKLRSLGGGISTPIDGPRTSSPAVQNPYSDPAMQDSEHDRSSAQSTLLQQSQVRRRTGVLDSTIDQREGEIEKIAQGVIDLSNMFQELNSMVIDQGSLLDRIDYNVERTVEHVKGAEKELKVATGYQKKSTKRKIILLLILIVVGMVILLVIKPKRSATAAPAPVPTVPGTPVAPGQPGGGLPPVKMLRSEDGSRSLKGVEWDEGRKRWEWKQRRRRGNASAVIAV